MSFIEKNEAEVNEKIDENGRIARYLLTCNIQPNASEGLKTVMKTGNVFKSNNHVPYRK